MEIGEYKEYVYASNVHIKDFDTESSVIEHLLTEFYNKARFWDIISTEEKPRR
jgi:hypothetical protein